MDFSLIFTIYVQNPCITIRISFQAKMEMIMDEFREHFVCGKCGATDRKLIVCESYSEDNRHYCPECYDRLQRYLTSFI